jgi:hypothetical protein
MGTEELSEFTDVGFECGAQTRFMMSIVEVIKSSHLPNEAITPE